MIPELVKSCVGTIILTAIIEKQAIVMSKMEVAYGLGALFMPLLSGFLISNNVLAIGISGIGANFISSDACLEPNELWQFRRFAHSSNRHFGQWKTSTYKLFEDLAYCLFL